LPEKEMEFPVSNIPRRNALSPMQQIADFSELIAQKISEGNNSVLKTPGFVNLCESFAQPLAAFAPALKLWRKRCG
jgi:hypothetical protein